MSKWAPKNDTMAETAHLMQYICNFQQSTDNCRACAATIPSVDPSFTCNGCACRMCHDCMTNHAQKQCTVSCPECKSTVVSKRYFGLISGVPETEEKHTAVNALFLHSFTCDRACTIACDKMVHLLRHAEQVNTLLCPLGGPKFCLHCAAFMCVTIIHARRCNEACPFPSFCQAVKRRL